MDNIIEKAILYATEKHMGQTRKDGTPYIYHPIAVAEELRKAGYDEKYQLTGILHDTLEDTDATVEELAQFGEDVLEAVKLLTRPDGCDEDYYVSCILQDKMAAVVKSVDKIHNVMSAAYCGPTGYVLTDSEERYARRYLTLPTNKFGGFLFHPPPRGSDHVLHGVHKRRDVPSRFPCVPRYHMHKGHAAIIARPLFKILTAAFLSLS